MFTTCLLHGKRMETNFDSFKPTTIAQYILMLVCEINFETILWFVQYTLYRNVVEIGQIRSNKYDLVDYQIYRAAKRQYFAQSGNTILTIWNHSQLYFAGVYDYVQPGICTSNLSSIREPQYKNNERLSGNF